MAMIRALRNHWPEYLCEAAELGLFMISAGLFTILLWYPKSAVPTIIPSEFIRRMLTGIAMGGTTIAQFIGGILGVFAVALFVREALSHPKVNYVATLPGPYGMIIAFVAEFVI